jgi:hypothetical protein
VKVLPNTVGSGRSSDSLISNTAVSGRVNVVKGLKRTVQLHMLGFGEVDIWLVQKRLPVDISDGNFIFKWPRSKSIPNVA